MTPRRREGSQTSHPEVSSQVEAELHLRRTIQEGKNWYLALLEAMRLWTLPEETYRGRYYRYLIGGEAFDWTLLAERLCESVDGTVPEQESLDLFFYGQPPLELSPDEFARLLGHAKYSAYLNYSYGVVVEEALQAAVMEEVEKSRVGRTLPDRLVQNEAFLAIYEQDWDTLFHSFRSSNGLPKGNSTSIIEMREFVYWLFKHRVSHGEPARVASDTRKGLKKLEALRQSPNLGLPPPNGPLPSPLQGIIDL